MSQNKMIYLCNIISDAERDHFYFADSALKKIRGYKKILEENGVDITTLSLSSPKRAFFQKQDGTLTEDAASRMKYYLHRLIFEVARLIRYMAYLTRERKHYTTIMTYSYTTYNVLLACFGHYMLGKKIVLDYEDGLFCNRTRHRYYSFLEKIILKISSGCVLINTGLRKRLPEYMAYTVINGIFLSNGNPACHHKMSGSEKFSILYSGELNFDYGLSLLFQLFSQPGAEQIDFHITGSGDNEEELLEFIQKNPLQNVTFHGYVPLSTLKDLEARTDGFALCQNEDSPIYHTNFPSKLFHYLGSGKPVFFNQCSLFDEYESFENAFPIENMENGVNEILDMLKHREKYCPNVASGIKQHTEDSVRKLKTILFA
ncbi:MAG: hypothetical protein B6245_02010 [Desulfobacteraceae bacterium 4572_88]|nr:MAG: hypothetical protein B6245_02010 [Desulfobacteraceae bacterium 4572_88]RLC20172.1 MAG: hypothetical protein DRI57_05440 [Deltaproteobacteria bacterium]